MNSKYYSSLKDEVDVAIDTEYSRFFNESTSKAITLENSLYGEAEQL